MSDLKRRVLDAVAKELGGPVADIDPDKDLREQISLDSMQLVAISARLEEELGIELPISIMEVRTFNEFLSVVQGQIVGAG